VSQAKFRHSIGKSSANRLRLVQNDVAMERVEKGAAIRGVTRRRIAGFGLVSMRAIANCYLD
jgi:hypothetical protein